MFSVLRRAGAQVTVLAIGRWLAAHPDAGRDDPGRRARAGQPHVEPPDHAPALGRRRPRRGRPCGRGTARLTGAHGPVVPAQRDAAQHADDPGGRRRAPGTVRAWGTTSTRSTTRTPGRTAIAGALARSVRPGSIVSLHLGHPGTLAALPAVLAHLHDRGLAPVTASPLAWRLMNG